MLDSKTPERIELAADFVGHIHENASVPQRQFVATTERASSATMNSASLKMPYRALLLLAAIGFPFAAHAQSWEPSWTKLESQSFAFVSFAQAQPPSVLPPYELSLPDPVQPRGAWSVTCNARENPNVDLYHYDTERQTWTGPLAGPVYRSPTDSYVSSLGMGYKGIAAQLLFTGRGASYNGNTLVQAVFFHDEPCYRAATEFGFFRYVKGMPEDETVYFYYEANANCAPEGKCRIHGADQPLSDQQEAVPLPAEASNNSGGGSDWLYRAYLINDGAQWVIEVVDPYTFADTFPPLTVEVKGFFRGASTDYYREGASGYITATSTRSGPVGYVDAPSMKVAEILVAR
jgi:hypothetical protein